MNLNKEEIRILTDALSNFRDRTNEIFNRTLSLLIEYRDITFDPSRGMLDIEGYRRNLNEKIENIFKKLREEK